MKTKSLSGLLVMVCLLVLLLRQVDLSHLGKAFLEVRAEFLALGLATQLACMWIKSTRWSITIYAATGRPVTHAFRASMIGFAGNVLLPARLGEWFRVSIIDKHNRMGRSLALTTVGVTQLFDLLVLVGYALVVSIWATAVLSGQVWKVSVTGMLVILALLCLTVLHRRPKPLSAWLSAVCGKLPWGVGTHVSTCTRLFMKGLAVLNHTRMVAQVAVLTIVVWGLEAMGTYFLLYAFDIRADFLMASILVTVVSLSFAFPITPGNIGVNQAVSVLLLSTFDVPTVPALAYSMGAQGATCLLIVSVGMICFYREGMTLSLSRHLVGRKALEQPAPTLKV